MRTIQMKTPGLGRVEKKVCNTISQISLEDWHRKQIALLELTLGFFEKTSKFVCLKVHAAKARMACRMPHA